MPGPALPAVMNGPDSFEFVGEPGTLANGWNDQNKSALWVYNLHYFDDLRRAGPLDRRPWHSALIARWIRENPPVEGAGWAPYPTSLRMVNWIMWDMAGGELGDEARRSLANQAGWLARNLETHILGNHLFSNLKALVFAGSYFSGETADRWLALGLERLGRELREQVLPDGGNFELSPMYHAIFLADLLDLVALDRVFPGRLPRSLVEDISRTAGRMLGWLAVMTHPDGDPPHFNDCAIGIAPGLAELEAYAVRLDIAQITAGERIEGRGATAIHLAESGYVRLEGSGAVAFCDVAQIGPSYLPGHGHADTLSYELSVGRRRIVVNGGTSCYGTDPIRLHERGTSAHSTVVTEVDSSEVWGGFRVARRARPMDVEMTRTVDGLSLSAAHDGYRRLAGKPVHHRTWTMRANQLEIRDLMFPEIPAVARNILYPEVSKGLPDGILYDVLTGSESREPAFHAPRFGMRLATSAIDVRLTKGEAAIQWRWN